MAFLGLMWLAPAASPGLLDDTPPSVNYTIDGINGTNGWYRGSTGGNYVPSGTETHQASNTSAPMTLSNPIKYDSTPPVFAPSPDRGPNSSGWYRSPVTVTWNGSDKTSGIASCPSSATYSIPDSANAALSATCTDQAGNSASVSFPLKYDASPPVFAPGPDRAPNANGWYRSPVTVSWNGSDKTSGIASCPNSVTYSGPDSAGAAPSATCTDQAGNAASASFPLKYDSTPPAAASAAPARLPDANGWYNHQVTVGWSGGDATSGPVSCTSLSYRGPDGGSIAPSGICTDQAGNASAPLTLPTPIQFDATAPSEVQATPARGPDHNGWYDKPVGITWNGRA